MFPSYVFYKNYIEKGSEEMKAGKILLSMILMGALVLSLCLPAFAQDATLGEEKNDLRGVDFSHPYFKGAYMNFTSEEDLIGWSFERVEYDEWGESYLVGSSPKLTEDGLKVATACQDVSYLYFSGTMGYVANKTDEFSISLSPDIPFSYSSGSASLSVNIGGTYYSYNLGTFASSTALSTGPLGASGLIDDFSITFRNGYFLQASSITVRSISVGIDYRDAAGLEVIFADQNGNRLPDGEVKLSGDALSYVDIEQDRFPESESGEYWKLRNGDYTTIAPDAVIDGVPVDPDTYESTTVRYRKWVKKSQVRAQGEPKSVTVTTGQNGAVRFVNMSDGAYEISEFNPPEGYHILATSFPVNILWDEENYQYKYEGAVEKDGMGSVVIVHCVHESDEIIDRDITMKHSLNIANDISVNYLVPASQLSPYDIDSVYVEVTIPTYENNECTGSKTETLLPEYRDGYYCFVLEGLTAVQMNDTLTACLYGTRWGVKVHSLEDTYSIATYAMIQMNKEDANISLKAVCANLLRYGAMAQTYKDYRTDALADSAMTAQHRSYLTGLHAVVFSNNYLELNDEYETGFAWTGRGLNLGTRVGMTFRMEQLDDTLSAEDWTVVIRYRNGKGELTTYTVDPAEINNVGNVYTFEFTGLTTTELRTAVAVTVYGADDRPISKTLIYSPDTYGNGKTELLGDVCRALFAYSDSATAFFAG